MDDLKNKGPQDRSRISLSEDWEVKWWTKKLGLSSMELQEVVKKKGNSVKKVKEYLAKKK